jgi:hypothetical protein
MEGWFGMAETELPYGLNWALVWLDSCFGMTRISVLVWNMHVDTDS